jgi:hypothetical protein
MRTVYGALWAVVVGGLLAGRAAAMEDVGAAEARTVVAGADAEMAGPCTCSGKKPLLPDGPNGEKQCKFSVCTATNERPELCDKIWELRALTCKRKTAILETRCYEAEGKCTNPAPPTESGDNHTVLKGHPLCERTYYKRDLNALCRWFGWTGWHDKCSDSNIAHNQARELIPNKQTVPRDPDACGVEKGR